MQSQNTDFCGWTYYSILLNNNHYPLLLSGLDMVMFTYLTFVRYSKIMFNNIFILFRIRCNIMTTCLIMCWSHFCYQNRPDSSRTLLDPWFYAVVSAPRCLSTDALSPAKLWCGASVDHTCLSSTSHRWLTGLRRPSQHLKLTDMLVKPCRKRPQPPGSTVSTKGCTWSVTVLM